MLVADFEPQFQNRIPQKLSSSDWLNTEEPQVILFQGMRGSGKGVALDYVAERLHNAGILVVHVWGARSFENLYYAMNKNCNIHYEKMKSIVKSFFKPTQLGLFRSTIGQGKIKSKQEYKYYLDILLRKDLLKETTKDNQSKAWKLTRTGYDFAIGNQLHCKCHKAYPILWIIPDYVKIDEDSLKRFNGEFWTDSNEFDQAFEDGKILRNSKELTLTDREKLNQGKMLKPDFLRKNPLVKIKTFTTPTSAHRKEIFQKQYIEILVQARNENRIIVMNPSSFVDSDKFSTLGTMINMQPYIMNSSGLFTPLTEKDVGKAKKYWTKKQKSWHKMAIIINEARSVAPSSRQHGEVKASESKRAIFDKTPEMRHFKTWLIMDYQSPDDLFAGVRYQANLVGIKRASKNILGDDWRWLFDKTERKQMKIASKLLRREITHVDELEYFKNKFSKLKRLLVETCPLVGELPSNQTYITYPTNEYKRVKIDLPSFHHKQSTEDFQQDFGIKWEINLDGKTKEELKKQSLTKKDKKQDAKKKKKIKEEIMKKIMFMRENEKREWKDIQSELIDQQNQGIIPDMGYETKDIKYFSNMYNDWKKKNFEQE